MLDFASIILIIFYLLGRILEMYDIKNGAK